MVKSVLGVNHQGLRDWVIQRISAVIMAVYSVGLAGFFLTHPDLAYYEWHGLFNQFWVKTATLLFFASLLWHAWVGMWTVYTDYLKPACLCLLVEAVTLIALVSFFFAALLILWGI